MRERDLINEICTHWDMGRYTAEIALERVCEAIRKHYAEPAKEDETEEGSHD